MTPDREQPGLASLIDAAERFDALADTAELMGDDVGADRFHAEAAQCRMVAMTLLDD